MSYELKNYERIPKVSMVGIRHGDKIYFYKRSNKKGSRLCHIEVYTGGPCQDIMLDPKPVFLKKI